MPRFLRVKNFDRYQHYKHRRPTWIKLYQSMLDDGPLMALGETSRYIYVGLLLLAARTDNKITTDVLFLAASLHIRDVGDMEMCLKELLSEGFIEIFTLAQSKRLSLAQSRAVGLLRVEKSRVEKSRVEGSADADASISLAPPTPPAGRNGPGKTEWPDQFAFSPRHEAIASGFDLNVHREFVAFRDKAQAHGWRYKNWDAAFRNWLNKAVEIKEDKRR